MTILHAEQPQDHKNNAIAVNNDIEIHRYQRENIIPLLSLLNKWGNRGFAQYPYLYSPSKDLIVCPSDLIFINAADALIALAKKENKALGVAACISLDSPYLQTMYFDRFHLIEKMQVLGHNPSEMLYVAYFLTDPEHHNDPLIVNTLYQTLTDFAQEMGKTQICYMDDISEWDLSLRPPEKKAIEPWEDVICGCEGLGVKIAISWPTLQENGQIKECEHTLEFFVKELHHRENQSKKSLDHH